MFKIKFNIIKKILNKIKKRIVKQLIIILYKLIKIYKILKNKLNLIKLKFKNM